MCSFLPPALDDSLLSQIRLCGPRSKVRSNLAAHESWPGQHLAMLGHTPGLRHPPGSGCCFYSAIICEIYIFSEPRTFLPPTFPRYRFAIWPSLETGHQWPPPPHVELSRSWEWWGLTNKITITMLPMIMKTIISVLIWPSTPSWHRKEEGGRVGEEKSVLNLGLEIFGFRIFYDMRLLSPALASRGEMWVGHGVTCQMPTNITFTDNFCFLSKVFRNTSQT